MTMIKENLLLGTTESQSNADAGRTHRYDDENHNVKLVFFEKKKFIHSHF